MNQPLILPEASVKTATIAQALQKHLINGYLVAVRDLCKENAPNKELLALAIHRAINGIGMVLLRSYQLYIPVSGRMWTELHTLFHIAMQLEITQLIVPDTLPNHQHTQTITLLYTRALLLACARPNQLRQDEILATYNALDFLSPLAQLQDARENSHDSLFAVDLNSNRAPLYRSRFNEVEPKFLLEIDTSGICDKLKELSSGSTDSKDITTWRNELHFTPSLTEHLIQAWNVLAQRNFERRQVSGTLDVTVGLTNIHYHAAGGLSFTHFLNKTDTEREIGNVGAIFKKNTAALKDDITRKKVDDDPWGDSFDISGSPLTGKPLATANIESAIREQEGQLYKNAHPFYRVPLIDTSPGGYCIEWRDEIPGQVKAGELLGVREPSRNRWSLGVVRWANHTQGATQIGIQVLAPQITPAGLAISLQTGSVSEYSRALEIPALKGINQPATLVANAISFREYSKAKIYRRSDRQPTGGDHTIQLTRRLFATGAFSQFTYRELSTAKINGPKEPDDFDAAWD